MRQGSGVLNDRYEGGVHPSLTAEPGPLEALPTAVLALWAAPRLIGAAALAPVIEELTFRSYPMGRWTRATCRSRRRVWRWRLS